MSMEDRDGEIWLDGRWLPWREARVHVMTHTLHYGYGCFEGIRAYPTDRGPALFRLHDHVRRLAESAQILAIDLPVTAEHLAKVCCEAVGRNRLSDAYVRPLVFLGAEKAGVDPYGARPRAMVAAWSWPAYLSDAAAEAGIRARVSSYARHHPNVQMCRAKAISAYANSILAVREARRDGYDEALLLDTEGFVAEGSSENLFMVRDGRLWEPETTAALDGITRRTVHALAQDGGLSVAARRITRDELYCAEEIFLTGTAAEIVPVVAVDGRSIGTGVPGPITRTMQKSYTAITRGEAGKYEEWLSFING